MEHEGNAMIRSIVHDMVWRALDVTVRTVGIKEI